MFGGWTLFLDWIAFISISTSVVNSISLTLGLLLWAAAPWVDERAMGVCCVFELGSFLTNGSLDTRLTAFFAGRISGIDWTGGGSDDNRMG